MLGKLELAYRLTAGHLLGGAFVLQLQPRYLSVPESASVSSWTLSRLFTHVQTTCPKSHSSSVNAQKKKSGNLCGALLGCNELSSSYPLMTLPVRRAVIRPNFASIEDTLPEEFENRG